MNVFLKIIKPTLPKMNPIDEHHISNFKKNPCFEWIILNEKRYEGRLATKIKDWNLYIGKRIKFFTDDGCYAIVEVTSLLTFTDFGSAFDELGSALIPERTREQVVEMYNEFFSEETIRQVGVVAIGFTLQECLTSGRKFWFSTK
jgi:ASC-1-like (ASCH) protein